MEWKFLLIGDWSATPKLLDWSEACQIVSEEEEEERRPVVDLLPQVKSQLSSRDYKKVR